MSIRKIKDKIILKTKNTMYAIGILNKKVPIHLYSAKK
jgi:hypothetical protein